MQGSRLASTPNLLFSAGCNSSHWQLQQCASAALKRAPSNFRARQPSRQPETGRQVIKFRPERARSTPFRLFGTPEEKQNKSPQNECFAGARKMIAPGRDLCYFAWGCVAPVTPADAAVQARSWRFGHNGPAQVRPLDLANN